jgi:hypothetical protein
MADIEGALKKLDRLTQEEARMALAEVLRISDNVHNEVKVVDGKVERVDDKVDGVGDKVEDVCSKVEDIDEKMQCVDEKVQVVIDGARGLSTSRLLNPSYIYSFRRQAIKSRGKGSEIDNSTDGKWHRRNQVFVSSY